MCKLWVDLPSVWGLTKAMLNKSRIGIWLIWLQVVFVAQQQACILKKVENYHSTMKKKNFPTQASGMRCSCQLNQVNSRYHINPQCHNLLTIQMPLADTIIGQTHFCWYHLQGLLQVQVKIAIDLVMQTRVGATQNKKQGPPIL